MQESSAADTVLLTQGELASWRGFLRVHAALERELDAELIAAHGLPLSSYEVLLTVADAREERMRMSEIADSVLLSRSGVTRLVDRLERDGLVERVPCEDDARGQYAVLTGRGRAAFDAARATHLAGVRRRFLERFDADELNTLAGYWERLAPGASS
jgi:DNA-binding MarR family transcriptional regulator